MANHWKTVNEFTAKLNEALDSDLNRIKSYIVNKVDDYLHDVMTPELVMQILKEGIKQKVSEYIDTLDQPKQPTPDQGQAEQVAG